MRAGYFFRYFVKNLAFVTIFGLASAPVLSVTKESGNLGKYLNSIDFGDKNAGDWQSPDQTIMDQYAQAVSYFLAGDMDNADAIAQLIGFEVVELPACVPEPAGRANYL